MKYKIPASELDRLLLQYHDGFYSKLSFFAINRVVISVGVGSVFGYHCPHLDTKPKLGLGDNP